MNLGLIDLAQYNLGSTERVPRLVEKIDEREHFIGSDDKLYIYNEKIYVELSLMHFCRYFEKLYKDNWAEFQISKGKNAFEHLIARNYLKEFTPPAHLIAFQNGLFDMNTGELGPFNPKWPITQILPFDYTLDQPILFKYALATTLSEADITKLLKFVRYVFTPSIEFQLAQLWIGDGNNGKSVLVEFLSNLIGDDYSTAFDLAELNKDAKSKTLLNGKRLAICSEIGGAYLNHTAQETLKNLIGDKKMVGRGAYERTQKWINTCKFIMLTNTLPQVEDCYSKAFFRRWQLIHFNMDFTGKEDRTLYEDIIKYEGGAVLSYLFREIDYSDIQPDPWEEVMEMWNTASNNVLQYIEFVGDTYAGMDVRCTEMYEKYKEWCILERKVVIKKKNFYSKMDKAGIKQIDKRDPVTDGHHNYYQFESEASKMDKALQKTMNDIAAGIPLKGDIKDVFL